MDPVQLTIVIVSLTLTLLIVILSIQVWYILKEMHRSLIKMNKMLDDAGKVSGTVSDGITSFGGMVSGLKAGVAFITKLRGEKGGRDE